MPARSAQGQQSSAREHANWQQLADQRERQVGKGSETQLPPLPSPVIFFAVLQEGRWPPGPA